MKVVRGIHIVAGEASEADIDWIAATLQAPAVHLPLGCSRAPSRDELASHKIALVESGEDDLTEVDFLVFRDKQSNAPIGTFLHYGWDSPRDTIRELDLVLAGGVRAGPGLYIEAVVVGTVYLFRHRLARRLRWRVPHVEGEAPRAFQRVLGQRVATVTDPDPTTGELVTRDLWEIRYEWLDQKLKAVGASIDRDLDEWPVSPWDALRR